MARSAAPNVLGVEGGGRLHRDQGEELQDVVLDDVAHRARLVVVTGPLADPLFLRDGDEDGLDQRAIPHWFEERVRESQRHHVLNGVLGEVVVDAEDLLFLEGRRELRVELARRGEVVTQGFLDHDPSRHVRPVGEPRSREARQDLAERLGRSREIEDGGRRA